MVSLVKNTTLVVSLLYDCLVDVLIFVFSELRAVAAIVSPEVERKTLIPAVLSALSLGCR